MTNAADRDGRANDGQDKHEKRDRPEAGPLPLKMRAPLDFAPAEELPCNDYDAERHASTHGNEPRRPLDAHAIRRLKLNRGPIAA